METLVAVVFVLAYAAIAFEHPLHVNKSATALIAAGLMWTFHMLGSAEPDTVIVELEEKLSETAAIVLFLISAMTIVEVVDSHQGFSLVTRAIKTTRLARLTWMIGLIAFILSAILDNMTTTIVMVSLLRKVLRDQSDRLIFAGVIVIAANAGGAWTPIGDVTTTMLWIGDQITSLNIMAKLLLPSLVCLIVPLVIVSMQFGQRLVVAPLQAEEDGRLGVSEFEKRLMLVAGLGALVFVPVFKSFTHLPPYLCILLALGMLWLLGEFLHRNKSHEDFEHLQFTVALKRIDMASAMFFVGILLAVGVLSVNGQLPALAGWLVAHVPGISTIVLTIGVASAVVDNIPLVAAVQGMFSLDQYPTDSYIWEFLAYCAGTGGSMLVIGSAAGVAAMGIEKIDFFWYARRIGPLAAAGYFSGAFVYMAMNWGG